MLRRQISLPAKSKHTRSPRAKKNQTRLPSVTGDEFERAYEVFHAGFDPKDAKPTGYRLDVTTMDGKDIRLYMFDYFTYGWGMACSKEQCDRSSRFVMLDMNQDPQPLSQPI